VSGESPAESVPIANSIIKTGIVGHTTSGKQIKLGMDLDALSPQDAQEASLLHRNAQEQLLNAMRANGNPAYKTAARDHLDAEFDLASRSLQTASDESSDDDDVFASTAKSFGALGDIGAWSPSPMWAGEQLGGLMGLMLSKSIGMERAGHKYIMRKPKAGGVGGYDYTYADEPHSKETLKAAPLGSKLEATHNGATDTYTKTERDSWVGSSGGAISSGWFVGKPSTLTHPGGFEEPAKASPAPEKAPAPKEQPNLFGETPSAKPAPKLQLTAKPVQQGLFGDSAFEGKPAPKKEADPLVNDKRQQGLFVNVDKPKPEEPKTEARRLTVDDARKLGASAHAAGRISASAADPDFNERIKEHNNAFGSLGDQMIPVLTAWNKGWHAANMANDEPAPAKEEPKSAMVEAAKEAEKQPAIASADVDVDAADAANAWKVEPYDEAHEMDREHEAAARDKERIEATRKHLDKTKEEVAAAKGTRKEKQAAEWLKTAEANHAEAVERAARLVEIRAARRAAKKVDVERHMGEASARVKLASDARKRLAAEAEKAKPKKLAETETDTARRNRQREREVGEHIPDSAKDRADERRLLTKGDLDALSFSEAHRLVNKRNAMPVYSLDQFKARGASPGAAHLGLALANLVGPSPPEDSDKSRRAYLDGIRLVHGIMDHANTVEEYDAAVKELNEINAHSFFGGGKPIAVIQTARRLTDEEKAAARAAGRWHSGDYEGIDRLPGNYASEVLTPRVQKENPDLAVGARYGDNGVEFYTYSKSEKSEIQESIKALGKRFNDQLMGGKGKIWSDAHKQARDAEKLGVAGWDHLEKTGEEKASKKTGEKEAREAHESGSGKETKLRWRQSISDKPAVIKPTVNVTHADVNRMNATFGFRAGQPGHSIPNVELAHHHKYAEMAFHDLANVLGIEPKFVSMNGRLGMAFAARGHGKAMAHYEPEKKVINITRYAGAGTIAHEWGHFMDNTVAEIHRASGSTKGRVYGSSGDTGVMPEDLRDAFKAFRTAIATPNPETVRKVQADHDKRFAEAKANVEKLRAHTGRLSYASTPEERADYKAALDSHNGNLDKIATQRKFLANPTSDYMMMSLMHDGGKEGKYWSAPEEMFARAFESYVQEKLESNGRRNSYLVDGARETGDPLNDEMMPYPMKAELPKIHGAIERVVKAMRSGGHFEKAMRLLARPLSARRQAKHVDLFIAL
jgi:hypothetical protein